MIDSDPRPRQTEEISLRDIFLFVGDYLHHLLKRWYIIAIAVAVCAGISAYRAINEVATYNAGLSFSLNEEASGGGLGLGSVLGQFGIGRSGGGTNFLKLVEIARSSSVLDPILLDSIALRQDTLMAANVLIELYNYHEHWIEQDSLRGFYFTHNDIDRFGRTENRVMKQLRYLLQGNPATGAEGLCTIEFNGESGVISMRVSSRSELLSLYIIYKWYQTLSMRYITQATEPQQLTLNLIQAKVDSIRGVLNTLQGRFARLQDRKSNIVLQYNLTEDSYVQRELGLNQIIYGEAVKNMEQARFLLANQTPAFAAIELPREPLPKSEPSLIIAIIKGGLIGGILSSIVLAAVKIYKDTMQYGSTT